MDPGWADWVQLAEEADQACPRPIKKRKLETDCSQPQKKSKLTKEGEPSSSGVISKTHNCTAADDIDRLTSLPDDVLLIILKFLDHVSLLNLQETCTRFERLCQDYTLWKEVRYLTKQADEEGLECIAQNVLKTTNSIRVMGLRSIPAEENAEWLNEIVQKCPNLSDLALWRFSFDCRVVPIKFFPSTLTRLDLSRTNFHHVPADVSYFRDVSLLIPNLKTLILTGCDWWEPHSLMAMSKCPNLEELYLNDCEKMTDCLAYTGLSTRAGFRKLHTLDLRNCSLSNSELLSWVYLQELKNVYLQNPPNNPSRIDTFHLFLSTLRRPNSAGVKEPTKVEKFVLRDFPLMPLMAVEICTGSEQVANLKYLDLIGTDLEPLPHTFPKAKPDILIVTDRNPHMAINLDPL